MPGATKRARARYNHQGNSNATFYCCTHAKACAQSHPNPLLHLHPHPHRSHSHFHSHSHSPSDSPSHSCLPPHFSTPCATSRSQRHCLGTGTWQHPSSTRECRYSDFVPCTYDERTIITRLYNYARTLLSQPNGSLLSRSRFSASSSNSQTDFEMITSTPSPTFHANPASSPPRSPYISRSRNGPYRYPQATSPHPPIKTPPAAAFPRRFSHTPPSTTNPHKRSLSTANQLPVAKEKSTVDVGTQYSPPLDSRPPPADLPSSLGKRRDMSISPQVPPEPPLEPQLAAPKHPVVPSSFSQLASASSVTLAKTSSTASSSSQGSSPKRARPAKPPLKFMPEHYETCDVKELVTLISNMLMELIRFNDDIPLKEGRLTRFHSRAPPGISVKDYLQRLTTHATLSPPILLSMVYYIDRLCALYPAFTISSLTVHRFLITSATVASKGLSDSFWTNNTYARVGGVSLKELALLELEFLWRVEWRIVPKPEVLVDYYRSLVERSEGYQIQESGFDEKADNVSIEFEEIKDVMKEDFSE